MSVEVISALERLQVSMSKSSFVFTSEHVDGRRVVNNVNRDFVKIVKRAGLVDEKNNPQFTMHDMRRTFVTNLLASGTDPKVVQTLAGHKSIMITMRDYASIRAEAMAPAIEQLSKHVSQTG